MTRARVGFVVEQALGHVAYGMNLRAALATRDDLDVVWMPVPYDIDGVGRVPVAGRNWTLRGSARAARMIRDEMRRGDLDALFIHTQTISLFAAGAMKRIPTLLSLDATPMNLDELGGAYAHGVGSAPMESLKRALHRRVMRRARRFTTWSQWAKDSLARDYGVSPAQVTVVHPGTTLSNFDHGAEKAVNDRLQVLFVGGDFVRKGGDLLLDIYRERLRERCELHLVTGAEIEPEPGVHVHRGLPPHSPELLRLYAEADVFVLPTRGDCLAVVLGEAMAARLPIITTAVGAHAEAVEHGKSGYVMAVDDGEALGNHLVALAADRGLVRRLGERSRAIGEASFDMAKGANVIGDILVNIASGGASGRATGSAAPKQHETVERRPA